MDKYERRSSDSQSDISQEDESYHSAKSEPDEDMSPPVAPIVSRASRTEPQEADQAPKMHIDPEEPRDPSTVLRSHPRRFVVHRSGDPHYQRKREPQTVKDPYFNELLEYEDGPGAKKHGNSKKEQQVKYVKKEARSTNQPEPLLLPDSIRTEPRLFERSPGYNRRGGHRARGYNRRYGERRQGRYSSAQQPQEGGTKYYDVPSADSNMLDPSPSHVPSATAAGSDYVPPISPIDFSPHREEPSEHSHSTEGSSSRIASSQSLKAPSPRSPGKLSLSAAPFIMPAFKKPTDSSPLAETSRSLNTNARAFVPRAKLEAVRSTNGTTQPMMTPLYGAPVMLLPGSQPVIGIPVQYFSKPASGAHQQFVPGYGGIQAPGLMQGYMGQQQYGQNV